MSQTQLPNDPKQKIMLEQLKSLMASQLQQQQQSNKSKQKMHKIRNIFIKFLNSVFVKMQNLLVFLDRFVNFITKKEDSDRNDVVQAARQPIIFGTYIILIFVVFGGIWTSVAPLNSAAIAIGLLVPSGNKQIIQHQEGGIVKNIFVKEGDHVKEGDKLVELDDTRVRSLYEDLLNQYRISLANECRLIAERDDEEEIKFDEFLQQSADSPEVKKLMQTQINLFIFKKESFSADKESLGQKIAQTNKQIEGLDARKTSFVKSLKIITKRLQNAQSLVTQGYVKKDDILDLEAKEASLKSEIAMNDTEIIRSQQEITKGKIEIMNLKNKYMMHTLSELKETQQQVASTREKFFQLQDSLKRMIITSPVDGVVNILNNHTIGGIISPGALIVEISPTNDALIIEAKVHHKNIDSVHVGLVAKVRFSAFKSRTTPLFTGKVISISPDIVQDRNQQQQASESTYVARIELDMNEFNNIAKAKKLQLHPGMQAEVQIITGTKTLLRYLLDPVTDVMFKAFREK
jgi:HlyD family secretion protein